MESEHGMDGILAIDSGGTKCEAVLADKAGTILAQALIEPEPGNGKTHGSGRVPETIHQAIGSVMKEWKGEFELLHLTSSAGVFFFLSRNLLKARSVSLLNIPESDAVLAAEGIADGVVAVAGTGAFAHLRWNGRHWHSDGYGPLLGDRGSGYAIGREALRAAIRANEAPRHATRLTEAVAAELNYRGEREQFSSYLVSFGLRNMADRTAVARFARVADRAAVLGDVIAASILERAADDLAETVADLVERAEACDVSLPVVGSGSVVIRSNVYWNRLVSRLKTLSPNLIPRRCSLRQVAGQILHVMQHELGVSPEEVARIRQRFRFELKEVL